MPERVHFQRDFDSYQRMMLRLAVLAAVVSLMGSGAALLGLGPGGAGMDWGPIPETAVAVTGLALLICPLLVFPLGARALIRRSYGFCLFENNELTFVPTFTKTLIVVKRHEILDFRQGRHGVLIRVAGRNPISELLCPLLIPTDKEWDSVAALVLLNREGRFG